MMPFTTAIELSAENHAFLLQYIHRESGISLGTDKLYLLQTRLLPVVNQEKLKSLDDLCARLRTIPTEGLRRKVVEAMTTHETLFFRDATVFDALRLSILPDLARHRQATQTLRIWSAACSSGQEAYSIAILLLELGYGSWNVQILGTDLSSKVLARAAAGRFMQIEVNRGMPADLLHRHFERAGADWQIKETVRRMVRFSPADLRDNMHSFGPFDLVLCRNVLIYFDMETRKRILGGIRQTLFPGGYLLLGSSETTFNLDESFKRKTVGSAIVYQNPGGEMGR
jgi:chemotaxis protein methyltransferase CheR